MKAGSLKHFITFESLSLNQDTDGALEELWVEEFAGTRFPASIEDLTGRELLAASALNSKTSTRITIRYVPGIDPTWRIRHRNEIYNIESAIRDSSSRIDALTFQCSTGVNEG
jgi:SPP1 family predicted phage head-tail adaptor